MRRHHIVVIDEIAKGDCVARSVLSMAASDTCIKAKVASTITSPLKILFRFVNEANVLMLK